MSYEYRGYIIDTSDDIKVRNTLGHDVFPFSEFMSTQEAEQATDDLADINERLLNSMTKHLFKDTERPNIKRPAPKRESIKDHPALVAHIDAVIDITSDEIETLKERMKQRCNEIATAAFDAGYNAGLSDGVEGQVKIMDNIVNLMPKGDGPEAA